MISFPKKIILSLLILFSLSLFFQPLSVLADDADPYGLNKTAEQAGLKTATTETNLTKLIGQVINWGLGLLGSVFLILIIVGGFIWMTAAGNDEKIKKAKTIITAAIAGIVIVFLAYSLTYMIVERLSQATGTS